MSLCVCRNLYILHLAFGILRVKAVTRFLSPVFIIDENKTIFCVGIAQMRQMAGNNNENVYNNWQQHLAHRLIYKTSNK